jgi:excinuclease ABC subunit C
LVQRIRDATHRFAVGFHRQRRSARTIHTELLEIPGVGERTAQKLLRRFGSVTRVRQASEEDLALIVTRSQATKLVEYFRASSSADAASKP